MRKYNRIVIDGRGGTEVLKIVEDCLPEPGPGKVRVRILAAGVGYSDVMAQHGGYPLAPRIPFTPGYDFAGIVDKLGEGVAGVEKGQYVAALNPRFGAYAEYCVVPEALLVPFPEQLDPAEVVCLILNYLTAHCLLHKKANIQEGESVLVHSAAGGVGTAMLQLGSDIGLKMYGTASQSKHAMVKKLGAIPIDYRKDDFVEIIKQIEANGVDAAFDPIGGANLNRSYKTVKKGGRIICYGFAGNNYGGIFPMISGVLQMGRLNLVPDGKRVRLCATPSEVKSNNQWYRDTLTELIGMLLEKRISPVIGARVQLVDVSRAHKYIEQGVVSGKVVLVCG
ncbi:MAG: oxidoreductase [Moraxellaceae bacterium]|nr:MAG: oxidoreductase [Moraxellaceae bacterium]